MPKSRWLRAGSLLLLICGGFVLAQALLRWGTNYYLREKARIPLQLGRLFINPATSRATLALQGEDSRQRLDLDLGQIRFDWWQVLLKRLRLGHVRLEGVTLDVQQDDQGVLSVGGIRLAGSKPSSAEAPAAEPSSWKVGTGPIDLKNIRIRYRMPTLDAQVWIQELHVDPAESWNPDASTPFHARIDINGGILELRGTCKPFAAEPQVESQIKLIALPLKPFEGLVLSTGITSLDGRLSMDLQTAARLMPATTSQALSLSGTIDFDHVQTGGPQIGLSLVDITGRLTLEGWNILLASSHPQVSAQGLAIDPKTRIVLRDSRLKPAFRWTIPSLGFTLGSFDMGHAEQRTPYRLDVTFGRFEKIQLAGQWALFAPVPDGRVALDIDGFNLSPFSPYTQQNIGYALETGLFDLKTQMDIQRGKLAATNGLVAHKLHFNKLKADELDESATQLGLPLNLCLSLIRDADDNIRLDVPLTGDLSDPKVPVGKLVWTLLGKAVVSALRSAASAFFPSGSKMGFDPLVFAPGQVVLSRESMAYLDQVGTKLSERPTVALRLAGAAVSADFKGVDFQNLTPDQKEKVQGLALRRAEAVRAYLVDRHQLDPKRLLDTAPKLDPDPAAFPRAELSL